MAKRKPLPPLELTVEQCSAMLHYITRRIYVDNFLGQMAAANAHDERMSTTVANIAEMERATMDNLRTYLTSVVDIEQLPRVVELIDRHDVPEAVVMTMVAQGKIKLTNLEAWGLTAATINEIHVINGKEPYL